MTDGIRRSRTAFIWVGLIIPLVILVVASAVIAAWLPELPDPVATHWGTEGVNGFGPAWTYLAIPLGLGGGLVLCMGLIAMFAHRMPQSSAKPAVTQWSPTTRFIGGINLALAAMMAFISLVSVNIQRGLPDSADTPDIGPWVFVGFGILVVFTALGWFLQPKSAVAAMAQGAPAGSIPLTAGERAAWFGTAMMARSGVIVLGVGLALLLVSTIFVAARGDSSWVILAGTTVLIAVLTASMVVFRIRVNANGLRARSLIGWPNNRIRLEDIIKVETVQINPMAEFGGWGWRLGTDGRRGIVLRAGEALQVTQSNGRVFVVTVDGASDAAAVLDTLRVQTRNN
ncbi:DUF1648 domain-containing protein [Microbacterium sp.]|uniref:DUF1648 domain-containing protein n=1 Tax=Microbacterium sp. TaxID=51671 RepID=UPI003F9D2BB8